MKRRKLNFAEYGKTQQYKIRKEYLQYRISRNSHSSEDNDSDTQSDVDVTNSPLGLNENNSKYFNCK